MEKYRKLKKKFNRDTTKDSELNRKKWNLQEDLFCFLSYCIMIITMILKINNPEMERSDAILFFLYFIAIIVWGILCSKIDKEQKIEKYLNILQSFNYYSPTIVMISTLIFYIAVCRKASIFILILIIAGSIILSIRTTWYKNKENIKQRENKICLKFEKLTPSDDIDLGIYEDAINFAFSDNEIQNIAISGSYSAGKSSLLASYKKKYKDKKFLHIL